MKCIQNITKQPIGSHEVRLLSVLGPRHIFTIQEAREAMGSAKSDIVPQLLSSLQAKGWIKRITRGRYAIVPLSSGTGLSPQLHEYLVAMELVEPATIAYWSALNYYGMTEQLPRTVFIATNHPVRKHKRETLGMSFRIISLKPDRYFGIRRNWIDGRSFQITDREKTIIDGLDLPQFTGGIQEIVNALITAWDELDEVRLRNYVKQIGNGAVGKRLGYILEQLGLGDIEVFRKEIALSAGFSLLDPTLPERGVYSRRWGLQLNVEVNR